MKSCFFFTLLLALCFQHVRLDESEETKVDPSSVRLPKSLKPVHYFIQLQPFLSGNFSIEGFVEITFDVIEATDQIVMHIADIITKNDTLKIHRIDTPDTNVGILSQSHDNVRQFYTVKLDQDLEEGQTYVMSLEYSGYLNEDLRGFYRSSYKDSDGNDVMVAVTQFEATDARRAFPCFDEPAMKAKFTIEIAREEGMRALSNMPRGEAIPYAGKPGWYCDKFNTSVPMSTYLVAFFVSDFTYVETKHDDDTDYYFRVWAREDAIDQADYAMAAGPNISRFYEGYFDVAYPLPKQDMIAVPDFSAGAMENWGIITYREARLLLVDELSTADNRNRVLAVIAHELAHMWFGDLVSPDWWTDIWLNEGFASYMEYLGMNNFDPSMKVLQQFVLNEVHRAFRLDALESSHPINQIVHNPDEINELFDAISYSKGASMLRMLSNLLTEETFRKALHNYLTELSYKNAVQDDLWRYLTEQAHADGTLDESTSVKEIMDTWTLQMGYPVVTVTRNEADGSVAVEQERFLLTKSTDPEERSPDSPYNYMWWIPLTFTVSSDPDFTHTKPDEWLSSTESRKVLLDKTSEEDDWIIFNIGQTGFYRVNYNQENWMAIIQQLVEDHTIIGVINRAQIIDDAFYLARAGLLDYKIPLGILKYLKNETEFVPLKAALNNLDYILDMFQQHPAEEGLKAILKSIVVPLYDNIGFADDLKAPHMEQLLRSDVVNTACKIGHESCIEDSKKLYQQWMENPDNIELISPNVKSTVLCTAISAGGEEEWNFAWNQYENVQVASEAPILLAALGCTKDSDKLEEYLENAFSPGKGIRKQDSSKVMQAVASNENGTIQAWNFIREQWPKIIQFFGGVSFTLENVIEAPTSNLNTAEQLKELLEFRKEHEGKFLSAERTAKQAVEKVRTNVDWMDKYSAVIVAWIQETAQKRMDSAHNE